MLMTSGIRNQVSVSLQFALIEQISPHETIVLMMLTGYTNLIVYLKYKKESRLKELKKSG